MTTQKQIDLAEAEQLACDRVKRLWPELGSVRPSIARRQRYIPSADVLQAMGVERAGAAPAGPAPAEEFTFTFNGRIRTPDGHSVPRVARITVSTNGKVVKASVSK